MQTALFLKIITMNQNINKTGANLYWLRRRLSITLEEMASILNEDTQTIEEWESGESEPGKESLQRLHHFFELDKSILLLLDLSQVDLFTLKKELIVQKKLVAFKRQETAANRKSKLDSYH
jgi:transcriptional regulator with XRE-family HTH domain